MQVLAKIRTLNANPDIDGIVVQMPLPAGVDEARVTKVIAVHKDVDACHPANAANVYDGQRWSSVASGDEEWERKSVVGLGPSEEAEIACTC